MQQQQQEQGGELVAGLAQAFPEDDDLVFDGPPGHANGGGRSVYQYNSDAEVETDDDLEVASFVTASSRPFPVGHSNLPQEVLLHIFSFVETSSTLASAGLVCRSWSPPAVTTLYHSVHLPELRHIKHFIRSMRGKGSHTTGWDSGTGSRRALWGNREGVQFRLRSKALELFKPSLEIAAGAGRKVLPSAVSGGGGESRTKSIQDLAQLVHSKLRLNNVRDRGLGPMVKRLTVASSEMKVILLRHIHYLLPNLKSLHIRHSNLNEPGPPLDASILTSLEPFVSTLTSITIEDVDAPCWPDLCRILREDGQNLRHLNIEAVTDIDAFESTSDLSDVFPGMKELNFCRLDGLPVGPNESVERLVSSCRFLKAVTLDYCLDVTMDVMGILWNYCENLEFLGLAGVVGPMRPDMEFELRPSLKTVRLVDCDVFNELFEEISLKAPNVNLLRVVFEDDGCDGIVSVSNDLDDTALKSLTRLRNIEVLALTQCPNMSAQAMRAVIDCNPVKMLDLHKHPECSLGVIDDAHWEELSKSCGKVEVLNMYGQTCLHGDAVVKVIREGRLRSLKSFCMNNVEGGGMVLEALAECCLGLERLSVVDCKGVDDEVVKKVVEAAGLAKGTVWGLRAEGGGQGEGEQLEEDKSAGGTGEQAGTESAMDPATPDMDTLLGSFGELFDAQAHHLTALTSPVVMPNFAPNAFSRLKRLYAADSKIRINDPFGILRNKDQWFMEEGLDILSLWEAAVERLSEEGFVF
ncbi:hypothetical protein HDV00_008764 [Rhizophlyctis rosea]|nr:hypothetical protein HDV00_008764 [Rhizophlyctis rosea]